MPYQWGTVARLISDSPILAWVPGKVLNGLWPWNCAYHPRPKAGDVDRTCYEFTKDVRPFRIGTQRLLRPKPGLIDRARYGFTKDVGPLILYNLFVFYYYLTELLNETCIFFEKPVFPQRRVSPLWGFSTGTLGDFMGNSLKVGW